MLECSIFLLSTWGTRGVFFHFNFYDLKDFYLCVMFAQLWDIDLLQSSGNALNGRAAVDASASDNTFTFT